MQAKNKLKKAAYQSSKQQAADGQFEVEDVLLNVKQVEENSGKVTDETTEQSNDLIGGKEVVQPSKEAAAQQSVDGKEERNRNQDDQPIKEAFQCENVKKDNQCHKMAIDQVEAESVQLLEEAKRKTKIDKVQQSVRNSNNENSGEQKE